MNSASNVVLPAGHAVMRSSSFHTSTTSPGVVGKYRTNGPVALPFVAAPFAVASAVAMNSNNDGSSNAYSSYPSGMVNGIGQLKPYATYAGTVSLLSKRSSAIGTNRCFLNVTHWFIHSSQPLLGQDTNTFKQVLRTSLRNQAVRNGIESAELNFCLICFSILFLDLLDWDLTPGFSWTTVIFHFSVWRKGCQLRRY